MSRTAVTAPPKVFLSYAMSDRALAQQVADTLSRTGLDVVQFDEVAAGGSYSDELRKDISRSAALVVVLSDVVRRREIPAAVLFEIGAAVGAGKPVYAVVEQMREKLPFGVPDLHVLPLTRIEEIARRVTSRDG